MAETTDLELLTKKARIGGLVAFELFILAAVLLALLVRAYWFNLLDLPTAWKAATDAWLAVAGTITLIIGALLYLWKGDTELSLPQVVRAISLKRGRSLSLGKIGIYGIVSVVAAIALAMSPPPIQIIDVVGSMPEKPPGLRRLSPETQGLEFATGYQAVGIYVGAFNLPSDYTVRLALRNSGQLKFGIVYIDSRFNYLKVEPPIENSASETSVYVIPVEKDDIVGERMIRFGIARDSASKADKPGRATLDLSINSGDKPLAHIRKSLALKWAQ